MRKVSFSMKRFRVLLIYPPFVSSWSPCLSIPSLAAYLEKNVECEVVTQDLNLEYLNYVATLADQVATGDRTSTNLCSDALELLRSPQKFPDSEEELLRTLHAINSGIKKATKHHSPTEVNFFNPRHLPTHPRNLLFPYGPVVPKLKMRYSEDSSSQIRLATEDEDENPFISFFESKVLDSILEYAPDLIGISAAFPQQHIPMFTLARLVKQSVPGIHITIGGAQISKIGENLNTSRAFRIQLMPLIDSIVIGEGERALHRLVDCLREKQWPSNIPGITHTSGRIFISNLAAPAASMNSLPTPVFEKSRLRQYLCAGSHPTLPLQVTRGCYWGKCTFCDSFKLLGRYRIRPPQMLFDDIHMYQERYGVSEIQFTDEALPPSFMKKLAKHVIMNRTPLRWSTYARFEKYLTAEFCEEMRAGGCRVLFMGIEAASNRVNDLMDKGVTKAQIVSTLQNLHNADIQVHLFSIIGFPGETREEAVETFHLLRDNTHLYSSYSFVPFILEKNASAGIDPKQYGIKEMFEDTENDLTTHFSYTVTEGLSMEETRELYFSFNDELANSGAYNPIYF